MQAFIQYPLGFTLFLALLAPAAAFEPIQIVASSSDDASITIDVSGLWPDTCPPQLQEIRQQGREITLLSTRETQGCHASPAPFTLSGQIALPEEVSLDESGIFRIRLELIDATQASPALLAFTLAHAFTATPAPTLESGFWWAEQGGEFGAGPGLGLSVEAQSGLISLSVMGYDSHGTASWYFGAGELSQGIAHLDLGQFEGGAGPFARYAAPETIRLHGQVDVETISPSQAILWFSQQDEETGHLDLKPLSITRFHFAQNPGEAFLGRWLVAGTHAESRATQWLHLVSHQPLSDGFVLQDDSGSKSLRCVTSADRPQSPPALCRLDMGNGDIIEFLDVGLRRLSGWDAEAHATSAFRLD